VSEARPSAPRTLQVPAGDSASDARAAGRSEPQQPQAQPQPQGDEDEEELGECLVCYDAVPSCVFLEVRAAAATAFGSPRCAGEPLPLLRPQCGHGGFCKRCAYLLFVRPPSECPTCRAPIDQVVELEGSARLGEVAVVR
jgi:hypothetical protein